MATCAEIDLKMYLDNAYINIRKALGLLTGIAGARQTNKECKIIYNVYCKLEKQRDEIKSITKKLGLTKEQSKA